MNYAHSILLIISLLHAIYTYSRTFRTHKKSKILSSNYTTKTKLSKKVERERDTTTPTN